MNANEFAALKPGDKIDNLMAGSHGEVVDRTETGVNVRWAHSRNALTEAPTVQHPASVRFYSFQTTAWMHWTYAPRDCASGPCEREDCRRGDRCMVIGKDAA